MKRAIPLVVLAVLLSSCTIRFDVNTTIRGDGSGTLALEVGFDEEFRRFAEDNGGSTLEFTGDLEDVPPGWSAVEFSRDGFEGMRISVEFDSIADLDARLAEFAETSGDSTPLTLVETSGLTRNGHGYDFQTKISNLEEGLTAVAGGAGGDGDFTFDGPDPAALFGDVFKIRYILTLPGEITSDNADSISGNTLTWNIGISDDGRVLTASSSGGGDSFPILAIVAVIAALIVAFVFIQAGKRRREYQDGSGDPHQPVSARSDGHNRA